MQINIPEWVNKWIDDSGIDLKLKKGAPEDVKKEFERIMQCHGKKKKHEKDESNSGEQQCV